MAESDLMDHSTAASVSPSPPSSPSNGSQSFRSVLESLVGKTVTVVTAESYEAGPVGHQLRAGFYRAKPIGVGEDVLVLRTERRRQGKTESEPVKQFIPFERIQRVSVMKTEIVLHL